MGVNKGGEMAQEKNVGEERCLYTAEEILEPREKEKWNLLAIFLITAVVILGDIFAPIPWWVKVLATLFAIGVNLHFVDEIRFGISMAKDLSAADCIFRAFEPELGVKNVSYSREYSKYHCLDRIRKDVTGLDGIKKEAPGRKNVFNIASLGFGFEDHARTSFFDGGTKTIMPRLQISGSYKGLDYNLVQYKKYADTGSEKSSNLFGVDDRWSNAMNFIEIKLPDDFLGYVEVGESEFIPKKKDGAIAIETDDIIFNKQFKVITNEELGAFMLLNPRHIMKIRDFYDSLRSKKWANKFMLLFMNGYLYTQNDSSTWVDINAPAHKKENIKRAIKKCKGIDDFIRTYVDGLELDKEDFTTRKKGA